MDINIKINEDRKVLATEVCAGVETENKATRLLFEFPDFLQSYNKYIEFDIEGEKLFDVLLNNEYYLKSDILKAPIIECQIVFKNDEEVVWKSIVFRLYLERAIEATKQFDPEQHTDILNTIVTDLVRLEEEKANKSDVYNKTEIDTKLEDIEFDDTEIRKEIEELDKSKVDKEEGKGLSTNDFTNEEKEKLEGLENYNDTAVLQEIEGLKKVDETLESNIENEAETRGKAIEELQTQIDEFTSMADIVDYASSYAELLEVDTSKLKPNLSYIVIADETKENHTTIYTWSGEIWVYGGKFEVNLSNYFTKKEINAKLEEYVKKSTYELDKTKIENSITAAEGKISNLEAEQETIKAEQVVQNEKIEELQENDASQNEAISVLEQEVEDLKANQIYNKVEGEVIEITDATSAKAILEADGKSTQETRSGKNQAATDDPNNPDANYVSSGGGTSAVQYDASNGFFTPGHRRIVFTAEKSGQYAFSIDVKKREEGTIAFGILLNKVVDGVGTLIGDIAVPSKMTGTFQRVRKAVDLPVRKHTGSSFL